MSGERWHAAPKHRLVVCGCEDGEHSPQDWVATASDVVRTGRERRDAVIADHERAGQADGLRLPAEILRLLKSRDMTHPFPWQGLEQPWPNEASRPESIQDSSGKTPFSGNWREVCVSTELAWRCVNFVAALAAHRARIAPAGDAAQPQAGGA